MLRTKPVDSGFAATPPTLAHRPRGVLLSLAWVVSLPQNLRYEHESHARPHRRLARRCDRL